MTDKQNTGGPAFPSKQKTLMIKSEHRDIANEYEIEFNGMTLRDYFAAAFVKSGTVFPTSFPVNTPERVAKQAYELADAMLKARNN